MYERLILVFVESWVDDHRGQPSTVTIVTTMDANGKPSNYSNHQLLIFPMHYYAKKKLMHLFIYI